MITSNRATWQWLGPCAKAPEGLAPASLAAAEEYTKAWVRKGPIKHQKKKPSDNNDDLQK